MPEPETSQSAVPPDPDTPTTPEKPAGLVVHLDQIRDEPKIFTGELPPEALELDSLDGARNVAPIAYDLRITIAGEEVLLQGSLELPIEFECVKCAQFFKTTQKAASFVRSFSLNEVPEGLDIGPELREELLLTFPTFPQCSPTCLGLCLKCGTNLNQNTCDCVTTKEDHRWSALDSLDLGEKAQE